MIEQIYLSFILIGLTIGIVLLYLWRKSSKASRINLALIHLNAQHNFDAPIFLREAWPLLSQAGIRGIEWRLDWFGVPVQEQTGHINGRSLYREIQVAEMKLSITLYQQDARGEQRYFNETLIETFLLLLHTDMLIKAGATDATIAQLAKLNLFLQHDMKNIAQFIQLMADQLTTVPSGKEQQVLDHLRTATPLIRHRADRIVRTLTVGQHLVEPICMLLLHEKLDELCRLYHLDYQISGTAKVAAPENTIDSALDNILKNYSDMQLRDNQIKPSISITITNDERDAHISISATNTPPAQQVERLFEPFWSSDPAGLGIGLYQAKQMLEMCKGSLQVHQIEGGHLQFHIRLPLNGIQLKQTFHM
ncbi:MAG: sensor histidine kinase [Burkholderiaceae bacterium]